MNHFGGMMKGGPLMKKIILAFFVITLLIACAGGPRPTPTQLATADYGPSPNDWKKITSDFLADELVRPESLYIRKIDPPIKAWVATPDREIIYGWGVCGMIVMGRSSLEPFFVLIHNDSPIYAALGFRTTKRIPGKTWTTQGSYDNCPNLFKY